MTRPPEPSASRRLRSAAFLSSFDRFTIPPLLVPIHRDLGVSLGAAAAVASVYFLAYGLSQPLWGVVSDRIGRVRLIRGAVIGGGLASVVAALAQDLAVLVVARGLAGLFFGAVVPSAITYIGDSVRVGDRQHALTILMAFATSGVAVATVAGGVAAELIGWRSAFLATAVLATLLTIALRGLPEPPREHGPASVLAKMRAIARRRWIRVVVALAFLEGAVIFGSLTFVAASLQEEGLGAALAGSAAAGFGLANVAATPLVTRAIPRVASPLLIAGGAGLAAAGLAVAAIDASVPTALVATLALGAGFGFLHSTMQLWATEVHPAGRAVTVSLFTAAVFIGGGLASAAAAPLADDGRFSAIFLMAAGGAALLAVSGSLLRTRYVETSAERVRAPAGDAPAPP